MGGEAVEINLINQVVSKAGKVINIAYITYPP
jgi:hypothetical protein